MGQAVREIKAAKAGGLATVRAAYLQGLYQEEVDAAIHMVSVVQGLRSWARANGLMLWIDESRIRVGVSRDKSRRLFWEDAAKIAAEWMVRL